MAGEWGSFSSSSAVMKLQVRHFVSQPVLSRGCPNALSPQGNQAQVRFRESLLGPDYGTTNGSGWSGFCLRGSSAVGPLASGLRWDSAAARVEPEGRQTSRSGPQRPQALFRDSLHRCLGRAQGLELRGSHFGKQSSGNVLFRKQKLILPQSPSASLSSPLTCCPGKHPC